MEFGIIIQCRTGSKRLPNKSILPFYERESILELIISTLQPNKYSVPVYVATTDRSEDDLVVDKAKRRGVKVFRGSEENVLQRFILAAESFNVKHIIRVCADNPLLDLKYFEFLVEQYNTSYDYFSFKQKNNIPVVRSHWGVFSEIIKSTALKKVASYTSSRLYQEHVTNFIYSNPELFKIKLLDLPEIFRRDDIRFTIDNKKDFELIQKLYEIKQSNCLSLESLINYLDEHPLYLSKMKEQIEANTK